MYQVNDDVRLSISGFYKIHKHRATMVNKNITAIPIYEKDKKKLWLVNSPCYW